MDKQESCVIAFPKGTKHIMVNNHYIRTITFVGNKFRVEYKDGKTIFIIGVEEFSKFHKKHNYPRKPLYKYLFRRWIG